MKKPIGLVLLLCCWFSLGYAVESFPDSEFSRAAAIQFKSPDWTIEEIDKAYAAGFRVIRRGFYWHVIEQQAGVYDFSAYDKQMEHAKSKGIRIIGTFFSNNPIHENDKDGGIQTAQGREGFAAWAAACAVHYQDHDVIWEIWNEPNVRTFWRKSGKHNSKPFADEYSALVNAVTPVMLKANPNAIVLAGSVSNYWQPSYEWTEYCFQNGVLDSGIRAWSVHPYGVKRPEDFAEGHEKMRALLKQYGKPNLPLVNTERGFTVKKHREGWSGGDEKDVYKYQAWNLVRQYMIDQLYDIKHTVWYEWRDDGFGLMDMKNKRHESFNAAQEMIHELSGFHFEKRLPCNLEVDYVLRFVNKKGSAKLVAWTAPPKGGSPHEFKEHELLLPITAGSGNATINSQETIPLKGQLKLVLHAKPQFIAVPSDVTFGIGQADVTIMTAADENADLPSDAKHLKLFEAETRWSFQASNKKGSFDVKSGEHGGLSLGLLKYDFTDYKGKRRATASASVSANISKAKELRIHAKSKVSQQITIRIIDNSGQTHQIKKHLKGHNHFEAIQINLLQKMEHWGGKKDGKVHFPIKKLTLSVPMLGKETEKGTVTFADAIVLE